MPTDLPPQLLLAVPTLLLAWFVARLVARRARQMADGEEDERAGHRDESRLAFVALEGALGEVSAARETLQRQRDLAEAERRETERYSALILGSMHSGVIGVSKRGFVRTANPAAGEILGVHPLMMVGLPIEGCLRECPALKRWITEVLHGQGGYTRREIAVMSPGGRRKLLGISLSPLTDLGGEVSGAVVLFSDLTEVRRLRVKVELKRRLESMGEMLAAIAHECRNAMGAVSGYARLLERGEIGAGERGKVVQGILHEVAAIESVLGECLDFVRPRPVRRRRVDLGALLEEVVLGVNPLAAEASVTLAAEIAVPGPKLEVDPEQLRQGFANLLRNAIQASSAGATVEIYATVHDDETYEVVIADCGCGISEEGLEHIFDPFFTTRAEGTGLGMSIAQRIVMAHEGRLEVDSHVGRGTTVRVVLPMVTTTALETA
jgi:PAS domain S-box-containing protein